MDETILDMVNPMLKQYNTKYGTNLKMKDIYEYELSKYPYLPDIYRQPGFFLKLIPYPNAVEVITQLHEDGYFVLIASNAMCDGNIAAEKYLWLEKYLPFLLPNNVALMAPKHLIKGDVIFDDAPHYIETFSGTTIVMDRPYNQEVEANYRIYNNNWLKFYEIIKNLTNVN